MGPILGEGEKAELHIKKKIIETAIEIEKSQLSRESMISRMLEDIKKITIQLEDSEGSVMADLSNKNTFSLEARAYISTNEMELRNTNANAK